MNCGGLPILIITSYRQTSGLCKLFVILNNFTIIGGILSIRELAISLEPKTI